MDNIVARVVAEQTAVAIRFIKADNAIEFVVVKAFEITATVFDG